MEISRTAIATPINDDYEWIQYNDKLKIIHSIKDDMYQMQSIISACNSYKQATRWFSLSETKDILNELATVQNCTLEILTQKRENVAIELRGIYIHRLLVNDVAMWANRRYAIYIYQLLDDIFQKQREQLETKIEEQKPRQVPKHKEKSYKYMIWKEEIEDNPSKVILHLVRRNNKTFYELSKIYKSDKKWFFRDNLPIAMTPNEDIKRIIKQSFNGNEATINANNVIINKDCLDRLHELIENYFNEFQE